MTQDGWTLYQPVTPYKDEHGVVVAHLVIWNKADNEIETSRFYSRPWAYWNFIDYTPEGDFEDADWAMAVEQANDYINPDHTITMQTEAINTIIDNQIPHANPYWQSLVVRLAYNAITNVDEFENLIKNSNFTIEEVQRMVDVAAGAVLQHPNFKIAGFENL
jgi:hypothetical protein